MRSLPLLVRAGSALVAVALLCPSAPAAQGGYRTTEFESWGLELPVPRDYDAIPVQPNEQYFVAKWTEQPNPREKDRARGRTLPALHLTWIEKLPEIERAGDEPPVGLGGSEGPATEEEEAPRIDTLADFLEHEWSDWWRAGGYEDEQGQGEYKAYSSELTHGPANRASAYRAWTWLYRTEERTIALIGICHVDDWKDSLKIWRRMATKLEISEPSEVDLTKWEKFYARNEEYIDPEYRLQIRSRLPRGWEADDTENYIYVYSTKNTQLLSLIKRRMETIRKEYERQFPPSEPVTTVSTVRICKDRAEYFAYGGPRGSGGYWLWVTEELVFFDYEDRNGAGSGTADTKIVLYHEAFHQYIYYSVGQLSPHTWFNEGYGDYFSGAVLSGKRVKSIGPNPWRVGTVQGAIRAGRTAPLEEFVAMEKAQYYGRGEIYYPQGWSLVYFLRESAKAKKHPVWSQILPVYFNALKQESAARAGDMPADPFDPERALIEKDVREVALEAAFKDVDFEELQEAWEDFTLDVPLPR